MSDDNYIWYLPAMILVLLVLGFAPFAQAAKQTRATPDQGPLKAVSQLEAEQQSFQQQLNNLKSSIDQQIDDLIKNIDSTNKNFEKEFDTTNTKIEGLNKAVEELKKSLEKNSGQQTTPTLDFSQLPWWLLSIEALIIFGGGYYSYLAFCKWRDMQKRDRDNHDERNLGISAIGSFLMLNTTADSILLTLVIILSRWGTESTPPPPALLIQLLISGIVFVISIICGAFSAAYVLNHVHFESCHESVVENPFVMGPATAQLLFMVIGSVFLLFALFL